MTGIKAPLCKRCAALLHGDLLRVYRIGEIESSQEKCPWCEKNEADAMFILRKKTDR